MHETVPQLPQATLLPPRQQTGEVMTSVGMAANVSGWEWCTTLQTSTTASSARTAEKVVAPASTATTSPGHSRCSRSAGRVLPVLPLHTFMLPFRSIAHAPAPEPPTRGHTGSLHRLILHGSFNESGASCPWSTRGFALRTQFRSLMQEPWSALRGASHAPSCVEIRFKARLSRCWGPDLTGRLSSQTHRGGCCGGNRCAENGSHAILGDNDWQLRNSDVALTKDG
jgi:hypothetical protein